VDPSVESIAQLLFDHGLGPYWGLRRIEPGGGLGIRFGRHGVDLARIGLGFSRRDLSAGIRQPFGFSDQVGLGYPATSPREAAVQT
jgi:hypothetical protein